MRSSRDGLATHADAALVFICSLLTWLGDQCSQSELNPLHKLALRARHRACPGAPAHHAVSNTTTPQLVVYSYWYLQGKVNTTTTQMVVYSYWDLQGKVCPPYPPGQINPSGGAQLGILLPPWDK